MNEIKFNYDYSNNNFSLQAVAREAAALSQVITETATTYPETVRLQLQRMEQALTHAGYLEVINPQREGS